MRKFLILQVLFVSLFLVYHVPLSFAAKGSFSEYYNQGIEFYKQGKYDQAAENFEKALELKPNDAYALYSLGNTHYCKSNYDEAVITYKKALKTNPDYAKAHYSLSLAYSKLGMTKKAEEEKKIFRQLSKGGKGTRKSQTKEESKAKVYVNRVEEDVYTKAQVKQAEKEPGKRVYKEIQRAPAIRERDSSDQSQTVFKGYSKEVTDSKPKSRVFTTKRYKKYLPTSGLLKKIKNKWSKSNLNKVWICTIGYILATQMWLCTVAFVGLMIWRVRKKIE